MHVWWNKVLLSALLYILSAFFLKAQDNKSELKYLSEQDFSDSFYEKREIHFLLSESKSPWIKYNPLTLSLGSLLWIYQQGISVQFSASCLFKPTCSDFSKALMKEYGPIKGLFLSADRLTRCNRIAAMDILPSMIDEHDNKLHENTEIYRWKIKKK